MSALDREPSLHISHIVCDRQNFGHRVRYRVDPHGVEPELAIPEAVVLKRWRARQSRTHTHAGCRLSPTVWRAVAFALPSDADQACRLSPQQLQELKTAHAVALRSHRIALPDAASLHAMLAVLGPDRLAAVLERHVRAGEGTRPGVPDLFLYAIRNGTGTVEAPRFVEVKKPGEPVSAFQREEIAFLRGLGIPARVLVLIERSLRV